jgi:hypothetical protein
VSSTGSKAGHPFLANGPRRSTRVGEPSRRPRVTHLTPALSSRGYQGSAAAEASLRAEWRSLVPSSFSLRAPRGRQRGFEYGAGVPVRIPCIAGGCPYLRARFNHTNHLCRSFRINRGLRPPAFRLPREGRQLPGSRGAFHRLESMCTGLAPTAFIDRSSDHADALLIGYPFP